MGKLNFCGYLFSRFYPTQQNSRKFNDREKYVLLYVQYLFLSAAEAVQCQIKLICCFHGSRIIFHDSVPLADRAYMRQQ